MFTVLNSPTHCNGVASGRVVPMARAAACGEVTGHFCVQTDLGPIQWVLGARGLRHEADPDLCLFPGLRMYGAAPPFLHTSSQRGA
jgi:hypothetical protein